jgi:hypothetical protein
MHADLLRVAQSHGIVMAYDTDFLPEGVSHNYTLAMDAQPQLVTVSNAGIPAFLSSYIDPKVIKVLTTPNKAAQILGETKKGDWITRTAIFSMVESAGEVSSYGDWSNNGSTSANVQFPQRQSYHYQTITQWGEKQLAEAGLAKIDWAQQLNVASAMVLDKFQNLTYFFGVQGLQNYGLLNDPSLSAAIAPTTKAAGGPSWGPLTTANEVYADIQALYEELVLQTQGLVDQDTPVVLALPPGLSIYLTNTNMYNVNVTDLLKKNFPNIRCETAPQYASNGINTIQMFAESIDGQETGYCSFTEKMRAHPIVTDISSFKQKKSQGTWGAIIFLPLAVATMVGA